ncbi:MAG: hypothetical protein HC945_03260 [Nitrosarchaeum sp.]|nr:hypothetical protein [Nitrosarchaeum sp.]
MTSQYSLYDVDMRQGTAVQKGKVTKELITQVVSELVGEEALSIVFYLQGKTRISEFIIAEELEIEINRTRHLLYKLLEHNIVQFLRKKDKIKGWYICYWDFNESMVPHLAQKMRLAKIQKLRERLENEQRNTFYMCKNACLRMNFDKSIEFNFLCPECSGLMHEQDNSRTIEVIRQKIAELEK